MGRASGQIRIAVGGISLESNDFVPFTAELREFTEAGFLAERDEVFGLAGTDTEIGGALAQLHREAEVVPLLAARGVSSGRLSREAHDRLHEGLLAPLRHAPPVDGVYLFHHGSMEAVGEDDPEGELDREVRAIVGPGVPIVVSCDLHANVTRRMVQSTDAILGYEHYPHDDVHETGIRAADLLLRLAR